MLKVKIAHFQLPSASQKMSVLKLNILKVVRDVKQGNREKKMIKRNCTEGVLLAPQDFIFFFLAVYLRSHSKDKEKEGLLKV